MSFSFLCFYMRLTCQVGFTFGKNAVAPGAIMKQATVKPQGEALQTMF